jgi:hypothetical protein
MAWESTPLCELSSLPSDSLRHEKFIYCMYMREWRKACSKIRSWVQIPASYPGKPPHRATAMRINGVFLRTELYINRAFTTRRKILTAGTVPPGLALGAAVKAEVEVHLHAIPVPALDPLLPSHLRREALPTNNLALTNGPKIYRFGSRMVQHSILRRAEMADKMRKIR